METKICKKCGEEKDIIEFPKIRKIYVSGRCKLCRNKYAIDRVNLNIDKKSKKIKSTKKWREKNKHGTKKKIDFIEYE